MQNFKSILPWNLLQSQIINGKEIPISILCRWDYCDTEIEGSEEYLEQFEKGIYSNCYIVVSAHTMSFSNSDRLYGIHCKTATLEQDLIQTIIDHNMIENAKKNLEGMILFTIISMKDYGLV
jgi:hypothetical protein